MINPIYLKPIDELTDEERSVFLYRFILKLSHKETATHLNKPFNKVIYICKAIAVKRELDKFRKEVFEEFEISDVV